MKKKDIIQLVKEAIKEGAYGSATLTTQGPPRTGAIAPTDEYPFSVRPKRTATGMMEEPLKEYTNSGQSGRYPEKENPGDMFQQKEIEGLMPNAMASRGDKAFQAKLKQHADWTEQSRYNNTFVHVSYNYTNFPDGEDNYFIHQTQHYNSNYDDFRSPGFTELYITKNKDTNKEEKLGNYIVDTKSYIRDFNILRSDGYLQSTVSENFEKNTGEKMTADNFKTNPKLQPGKTVTYLGKSRKIEKNDGFILTLDNDETVNLSQFNKRGAVKEAPVTAKTPNPDYRSFGLYNVIDTNNYGEIISQDLSLSKAQELANTKDEYTIAATNKLAEAYADLSDEERLIVGKEYDHETIAQAYLDKMKRDSSKLSSDDLLKIGKKVVFLDYDGDMGAAYKDLVKEASNNPYYNAIEAKAKKMGMTANDYMKDLLADKTDAEVAQMGFQDIAKLAGINLEEADTKTFVGVDSIASIKKDPRYGTLSGDTKMDIEKKLKTGGSVELEEEPNEISYKDAKEKGLKSPDKADISKDKDISDYELKRGMAVQKAIDDQEKNEMYTNDIGKDDYMDDEGRMAKSQMYKTGKYAMKLHDMLDDMEQLPAWVQAKLTKASDYLSGVYHYLDYEFVRRDSNLMEHVDKHRKRSMLMEGAMKRFFEMFDEGMTDEEIVQSYATKGTTVPETFISKARKTYEGMKKMKLELEMGEKEYRNSTSKMVNNTEEGMEPSTEEKQLASGLK